MHKIRCGMYAVLLTALFNMLRLSETQRQANLHVSCSSFSLHQGKYQPLQVPDYYVITLLRWHFRKTLSLTLMVSITWVWLFRTSTALLCVMSSKLTPLAARIWSPILMPCCSARPPGSNLRTRNRWPYIRKHILYLIMDLISCPEPNLVATTCKSI